MKKQIYRLNDEMGLEGFVMLEENDEVIRAYNAFGYRLVNASQKEVQLRIDKMSDKNEEEVIEILSDLFTISSDCSEESDDYFDDIETDDYCFVNPETLDVTNFNHVYDCWYTPGYHSAHQYGKIYIMPEPILEFDEEDIEEETWRNGETTYVLKSGEIVREHYVGYKQVIEVQW